MRNRRHPGSTLPAAAPLPAVTTITTLTTGLWMSLMAVCGLATGLGCQPMMQFATQQPQPLSYVGHVQLESPAISKQEISVPLSYQGGEWAANSAIAPLNVETTLEGKTVYMTVVTALAGKHDELRLGHRLRLPPDLAGDYDVVYVDPDGTKHSVDVLQLPE
jgi:hypothetical protein